MNAKSVLAAAAALALVFATGVARADDPTPEPKSTAKKATPAEKKEASAKRKADVAEARKTGELPAGGDAKPAAPYKASGTKESRAAERKEKRSEMAAAEKKGQVPRVTESGDPKK